MNDEENVTGVEMEREGLPPGWVEARLDELATDVTYGYTASSTTAPVGPRMLRITDIQVDRVEWNSVPYCEINDKEKAKYLLQPGDLVFARTGATVGKSFLIRGEIPETVYASYLIRVRAADPSITSFLSHFFKSPAYWNQIMEFSAGIGQPNVNGTKLKELRLPLPPLPEQIRIADKLDTLLARVSAGRERLERMQKLLKQFRQSVLSAAVSGELTREWRGGGDAAWEEVTLGEIAFVTKLAGFEFTKFVKYVPDGDLRVIKAENVGPDGFRPTNYSTVNSLSVSDLTRSTVVGGDLLMVFVGAGTAQVGMVPDDGEYFLGPNVAVIKPNRERVSPNYLEHYLRSPQGKGVALELAKGAAQPSLSMRQIRSLEVSLPPLPEQTEIVRRVESLFALADNLEQRYAQALGAFDSLTPALLAKAFRGELVPQDPNDEPASVLLERIRAARAAEGEKPKKPRKTSGETGAGGAGKRGRPRKQGAATPDEVVTGSPEVGSVQEAIARLEAQKAGKRAQWLQELLEGMVRQGRRLSAGELRAQYQSAFPDDDTNAFNAALQGVPPRLVAGVVQQETLWESVGRN